MNRDRNNFFNLISSDEEDRPSSLMPRTRDNQQSNSTTLHNSVSTLTRQNQSRTNMANSTVLSGQFNYTDVSNFRSLKVILKSIRIQQVLNLMAIHYSNL